MASSFNKSFKANLKTFTDRIDFKKMLVDAVEKPQSYDEHRIKVIYGLGGQGKTYLKATFFINEYLKKKNAADKDLIYCDTIDFEHIETSRTAENGLLSIARDLIEKGNIPLPAFSLAFLKLKQLTSLTRNLEEQYPYLFKMTTGKFNKEGAVGDVLQEIIEFAVGSGLSEAASTIPLLGFFAKKLTNKGKNKVIEWLRESDAKDILQDLDDMDKYELIDKLPMFLGWDVYKALQATAIDGIPKKRVVIIIDGYETLWSGERNRNIGKDLWIRRLAEYMTGVLFVIFGRESLRWHEIEKNQDVINGIEQFPIDGFEDKDAEEFLSLVPIVEKDVRSSIIKNAKGSDIMGKCLPLYLQLEAITYENIINSGRTPTAADFSQGNEKTETEVVTRLFKHMDTDVSNALEALSLCNYIDEEIIELLENERAFAAASVSMKTLSEYSFIINDINKLLIHGFVRDIASEQYQKKQPAKFKRIHEALFSFFDQKLKFEGFRRLNTELETIVGNAAFHKKKFDPQGFPDWILQRSNALYGNSMMLDDVLKNQLNDAVDYLEPAPEMHFNTYDSALKLIFGQLFYQLAVRYDEAANKKEATRSITLSIHSFESLLPEEIISQYKQRHDAGELAGTELRAMELYKQSLEKIAQLNVSIDQNIAAGEYFLKASNLADDFQLSFDKNEFMGYLSSIGRHSEAEAFFFQRYKYFSNILDREKLNRTLNLNDFESVLYSTTNAASDLARLLRVEGRYEEAKKFAETTLQLMIEAVGLNHIYTTFAKHSLAKVLIKGGLDKAYARQLLDEVNDVYENTYSSNNLYIGYLKADYFELRKDEEIDEVMEYYVEASRIFGNQTSVNRESIEMLLIAFELTKKIAATGESKDAEETLPLLEKFLINLFHNKFEDMKNLYGVFSPVLHKAMRITAGILDQRDEVLKAGDLQRSAAEFERLMNHFSLIRLSNESIGELEGDIKDRAFQLFGEVMSLPANPSLITIEVTKLSFYKTVDLFKVSFNNLDIKVIRYVLSDMEKAWVIDNTNVPLYNVGEYDLFLTADHIVEYAVLFFDTTMGRHGHFHLLRNHHDIPWEVDKYISEDYKEKFADLLPQLELISEDEDVYQLRGPILFKQSVFMSTIVIRKENGIVSLQDESLIEFYQTESGNIGVFDANNPPDEKIIVFETIPASVDPSYENAAKKEQPDTFSGHILQMLDIMEENLLLIHPFIEREGDAIIEFENFVAAFETQKASMTNEKKIDVLIFKNLLIYDYNAAVTMHNNYIDNYPYTDSFAETLRNKMEWIDSVIKEIDEYMQTKD